MSERKLYRINYRHLATLLTPVKLREEILSAFLSALMAPLTALHKSFRNYIENVDTSVNSQICFMEAMLNNMYDFYERRIFIRDVVINEHDFFLFTEGDGVAKLISDEDDGYPVFWFGSGQLGTSEPDFEIVFPAGYRMTTSELRQLRRLINSHKLASKQYRVVYE